MTIISLFYKLEKGVYSYEYIHKWEKFNETLLPDFYSHLKMEDNTYAD